MKLICPKCFDSETKEQAGGTFTCSKGHVFAVGDALIPVSRGVSIAKILTHPLRLRMLLQFDQHPELSASKLATLLDAGVTDVSYHMRVLRDAEPVPFVLLTKEAPVRGAIETFYRVNPEIVRAL